MFHIYTLSRGQAVNRYSRLYIGSGSAQHTNGQVEYRAFLTRANNASAAEGYILAAVRRKWLEENGWGNYTTAYPSSLAKMLATVETHEAVFKFAYGSEADTVAVVNEYLDSKTVTPL